MSPFDAFVLGVVQGLTEFLPVSSSGHLVLAERLMGVRIPGLAFEVVLHLGTLTAVLWCYRSRIGELLRGMARRQESAWGYAGLLLLASVPAGIVGVLWGDAIESAFKSPELVAGFLLVTGAIDWTLRYTARLTGEGRPGPWQAWWIGVSQAFAILPGISRSGSTVAMASWRGVEVIRAAEFSFLMSVPAILGAVVLKTGDIMAEQAAGGGLELFVAFATAAVVGVLAIRLFLRMLRRASFHWFGVYCWILGGFYLLAAWLHPALR